MKLGFAGDTQFKGRDLAEASDAWDRTLGDMKDRGVQWVCHTGDVCEAGNVWDSKATAQQIVKAFLDPVERHGMPVLIVEGNHDYHDPLGPAGLDLFRHPLVRIVQKDLKVFDLGSTRMLCLPWQDRTWVARQHAPLSWSLWQEQLENEMKRLATNNTILLGHVSIRGAVTESGFPLDQGDIGWDRHRLIGICRLAVFGHVHRPQVLWNSPDSVGLYAGCIRQNSYGERDCYTGWLEVDTDLPTVDCYHWRPIVSHWHRSWTFGDTDIPTTQLVPPRGETLLLPINLCRVKAKEVPLAERANVTAQFRAEGVDIVEFKAIRTLSPQMQHREHADIYAKATSFEQQFLVWLCEQGISEIPAVLRPTVEQFNVLAIDGSSVGALDSIHSISMTNVGGHVQTVAEFSQGWNAVLGSNGAGKSSLLESLFACAFNTWVSDDRDAPVATVPPGTIGQIDVEFSSGGTVYQVQRQWKGPSSTVWLNQRTNSGHWNVIAGGADKSKVAMAQLRRILGSQEVLLGSAFLQQGPADLISGPTATNAQRMVWMREWLGFQSLDEMLKRTQVLVKGYAGSARKLESLEVGLSTCQTEMGKIQELIGPCRTHLEDVRAKKEAVVLQMEERVAWLAKAEVAVVWAERRDKIQYDIMNLNLNAEEAEEALAVNARDQQTVMDELAVGADVRAAYQRMEIERGMQLGMIAPLKSAGCRPNYLACQFIDNACAAQARLAALDAAQVAWSAEEEAFYQENDRLLQDLRRRQPQLERTCSEIRSRIQGLQDMLTSVEPDIEVSLDDVKHAHEVLEYQRQLLPQLRQTEEQLNQQYHSMHSRWKLLSEQLTHLSGEREMVRSAAEMETALTLLMKATGREGISQRLIHTALPAIQQQLDDLIQLIDVDFSLSLSTLVENAKGVCSEGLAIMFHQGRKKHDVRSCSKGQQSLIRVLWRWAVLLARNEASYRVLFLDEPTAANDAEYTETILHLLSLLSSRFSQIILVSHSPDVVSCVPTKIYVERH